MSLSVEAQTNLNSLLVALDEQMQLSENAAYQAALKYNAVLSCFTGVNGGFTDTSTLATEATSTAINAKLPSLSSGRVPVSLPTITAELDCRLLTTNTTIATGSYFIYLKVLVGDVTINGLTFSSGENLNFEAINNVLYPAVELVIPSGKSIRLVRGY
jgi:hypothetical protein